MSRKLAIVVCITVLSLLLVGQAHAETIRVQSHEVGEAEAFMQEQFRLFTKETGIEVVHDAVPSAQTLQRTLVYVAGGQAPDVVISSIQYFEALAARGVFTNIGALAEDVTPGFSFSERFFPSLIEAYSFGGAMYGVPKDLDTPLLFFNKEMFEEKGIALPNDDWTFDDLADAAAKLTSGRGPGRKYGFLVPTDAGGLYFVLIPYGGEVLDETRTRSILDNEAGINTLKWLHKVMHEDQSAPRSDLVVEVGAPEMMKTARVAMTLQGPWFARYHMKDAPYDWDVTRIPRGPANSTRVGGSGIGITADSKNKEAAWRFVEWFTRPEQQVIWAQNVGWFPTGLAATELEGFQDRAVLMLDGRQKQAAIAAAITGRAPRVIERQSEMYAIMNEELSLLWTNERSPEDVAAVIKERVDQLLAK